MNCSNFVIKYLKPADLRLTVLMSLLQPGVITSEKNRNIMISD